MEFLIDLKNLLLNACGGHIASDIVNTERRKRIEEIQDRAYIIAKRIAWESSKC